MDACSYTIILLIVARRVQCMLIYDLYIHYAYEITPALFGSKNVMHN